MRKLLAAILLLTILISSFAFADDSVSYAYIMRVPMEDGYVVWDMIGNMRYIDNDGNVLWGEPFETEKSFEESEEVETVEDDTRTDMQRLTEVDKIFSLENGYICTSNYDGKIQFFDTDGKEVFNCGFEDFTTNGVTYKPFMPSDGVMFNYAGYDDDTSPRKAHYKVADVDGNVLWKFYSDDYISHGTMSEELLLVEGENKALSGNTTYVAYIDKNGHEVMRFDGKTVAGDESNFSQGVAFLCEEDDNGWPVNWFMVDKSGNKTDLYISNPEKAASFRVQAIELDDYWKKYGTDNDEHVVRGMSIRDIAPFSEGEEYTSAIVVIDYDSSYLYELSILASVSRQGEVKLLGYVAEGNTDAKICFDGKCAIETSVFDISNGNHVNVSSIPTLSAGQAFSPYLMDDGNIYVIVRGEGRDFYCSVVTIEGNVLYEPTLIEENIVRALIDHDVHLTGRHIDRYHSWKAFKTSATQIIKKDQIYTFNNNPAGLKKLYGFTDIYGNIVIEAKYAQACDFNNGYAVVCQDFEEYPYGDRGCGCNLTIINTNGEIVDRVEF